MEVFDRDGSFDPNIDAIVRVEAGRLRSYDQIELDGLLNGQVGGLGAFQNHVNVCSRAAVHVGNIPRVGYETARLHI